MQSAWAVGYGAGRRRQRARAAGVRMARRVLRRRPAGVLHALGAPQRARAGGVAAQRAGRTRPRRAGSTQIFSGGLLRLTLVVTLMNACTMFAWWGFNLWIPAYLSLSVEGGGIGLTTVAMSWFIVVMQVGMWFGYVTFGFISDAVGRKRTYVTYLLAAAVLMFTYASLREPWMLLVLGPVRRLLRHGLLQRVRRGHRRDLSDRHPRDRAGPHLQRRPHRQRRRAVPARVGGAEPRLRLRVRARRGCLRRGGGVLGGDSGNQGARAGVGSR